MACSFWIAEAWSLLGEAERAGRSFNDLMTALDCEGVYPEMIEPTSREWLGNLPQGLTHLAIVQCIAAIFREQGKEPVQQ